MIVCFSSSDVVYDTSIVPSLVRVLHKLLHINDQERRTPPVAYIASTIRNEETHQCFMQALGRFINLFFLFFFLFRNFP